MNEQQSLKYNSYLKDIGFEEKHIAELKLNTEHLNQHYWFKWTVYWLIYAVVLLITYLYIAEKSEFLQSLHDRIIMFLNPNANMKRLDIGLFFLLALYPMWHWCYLVIRVPKSVILSTAHRFHKKAMRHAKGEGGIMNRKPDGFEFIDDNFKSLPFLEAYKYIAKKAIYNSNHPIEWLFTGISLAVIAVVMIFTLFSGLFP